MKIARDLTPTEALCPPPACPALLELEDGRFAIIGKKISEEELPTELRTRIGAGETISILPATFRTAFVKQ